MIHGALMRQKKKVSGGSLTADFLYLDKLAFLLMSILTTNKQTSLALKDIAVSFLGRILILNYEYTSSATTPDLHRLLPENFLIPENNQYSDSLIRKPEKSFYVIFLVTGKYALQAFKISMCIAIYHCIYIYLYIAVNV